METTTIVCPSDFSEPSRHAAKYAMALAQHTGARVIGLHVREPLAVSVPGVVGCGDMAARSGDIAPADLCHRLAADFGAHPHSEPKVVADVTCGEPAAAIAEAARDYEAHLVVMGTRGSSGLGHLLVGSVTERVIRTSSVPVLSVSPQAPAEPIVPFARVLVATDLSSASLAALNAALRLAVHPAADVRVLHVIDDADDDALFVAHFQDVRHYADAFEATVRESLTRLTCHPFKGRPRPEICVAHGKASEQILAAAVEMHADLIVMGTHGRHALDSAIFGSTTNDVVRDAACPVLTARR